MPHHPSSSAAPTPSSEEVCVCPDAKKIKKGRPKRPEMMSFKDLPPLTEEQEKYLRESLVCIGDKEELPPPRKNRGRQPPINVFDAKRLMRDPPQYSGLVPIGDFKKNPPQYRRLTKCATLAIADYNSMSKTNYRFVNIEMAVRELVNGVIYHITFQARNAEKKCETFEATVLNKRGMRMVGKIRMKGSDFWYIGTLSELTD